MSLSVVIADDELLARKRLHRLLSAMPDVEVVAECDSAEAVLATLREKQVDALFLDIQMPGMSGVEALQLIGSSGPKVIFCTAHAHHAVEAFEHGALDYLLKPIEAPRLRRALDRLTQTRTSAPTVARLPIPTRQGVVLVDPLTVTHAVLGEELVTVHTANASYLTDMTLQSLEDQLPKDRFERVHRRAVLNLAAVARLEPLDTGGYLARTHAGHAVEVSRQSARALRRRLGLRRPATEDEVEASSR